MGPIRVLLADDHEVVRKGLRAIVEGQPNWKIVAEAVNGTEAVGKARECKPDIALLDISMPVLNGLDAARQIVKTIPRTKVLILTIHNSDELIQQVLECGARGYVLKSDAGSDLVSAVRAVSNNKTFFTPRVARMVLEGYLNNVERGRNGNGPTKARLTVRQREVVQLVAEGKSSKEMAAALGISVKTLETHRANVMRRLDCHSVVDLVRYAVRNNIITSA